MDRSRLNHVGTIATAVAAIVASMVALLREPEEPRARASYDVLSKKVEELQEAQRRQHDDVVAQRGYLEGYLKSLRESQKILSEVQAQPPPVGISVAPAQLPPLPTLPKPQAQPEVLRAPPDFAQLAK